MIAKARWQHFSKGLMFLSAFLIVGIDAASAEYASTSLPEGQQVALAVDPSCAPRIAFMQNGTLTHAYWNGQIWTTAPIPGASQPQNDIDIAVDHWGRSHVAAANGPQIQYFYREGTGNAATWIAKPLTGTSVGGPNQISLALRRDGDTVVPCIAYYDKSTSFPSLKFAQYTNGAWSVMTVDSESENATGRSPSLVIDFTGHAHIAYFGGSSSFGQPPKLKYAHQVGNSWEIETVFQGSGIETSWNLEYRLCEIALNSSGQPCILYTIPPTGNSTVSSIMYSVKSAQGWSIFQAAATLGATSVSLAANASGNRWLLKGGYVDNADTGIKQIKASLISGSQPTFFTRTTVPSSVTSVTSFSIRGAFSDIFVASYSDSATPSQFFSVNNSNPPTGTGTGTSIEQRIRQTLGVQDPNYVLKPADLFHLTSLDITGLGASDLSILTNAVRLTNLSAANNKISDLTPLLSLPKLASLVLSTNYLDSPQAVSQIQQLESKGVSVTVGTQKHPWNVVLEPQLDAALRIRMNIDPSRDEPFTSSHAQNLVGQLVVPNAGLTSLRGLEYATNLTSLNISNSGPIFMNRVTSLAHLAGLSQLTDLRVAGNWVSDLAPILGLEKLQYLDVSQNGLDESSPSSPDAIAVQQLRDRGVTVYWQNQQSPWNWVFEPALASAVRSALSMSSNATFTPDKHAQLTQLAAVGKGIRSIAGLELASNLQSLILAGNNISDISPLKGLVSLKLVDLTTYAPQFPGMENTVKDLSSLSGLSQLQTLYLRGNHVTDLTPLVNLWQGSGSRTLDVSENGLDFRDGSTAFLAVAQLQSRGVSVTWANQRSPWNWVLEPAVEAVLRSNFGMSANATFTTYQETFPISLDLSGWGITSLAGLDLATSLTTLDLHGNNISDISLLAGLTNLQTLLLAGNNVSDISALSGLTHLVTLDLSNNPSLYLGMENAVGDLTPLAGLTQLTTLNLQGNRVTDLTPLVNLWQVTKPRTLDVSQNGLDERSGSADFLAVAQLQSRGVTVTWSSQRSPWNGMIDPALEKALRAALGVSATEVITPTQQNNLDKLNLDGNGTINLNGLEFAANLSSLSLDGRQVGDLSMLPRLAYLSTLNLQNSTPVGLSALNGISSLRTLDLRGAKIVTTAGSNDRNVIDALKSRGVSVSFLNPPSSILTSTGNYSAVNISWSSDSSAQSHTITRRNVQTGEVSVVGTTASNSFADSTAQPGDIYSYTIQSAMNAQSGAGTSTGYGYEPLTFSGWLQKKGFTGGNAQGNADPNKDGVPNLVDFAFNLTDSTSPKGSLPQIIPSGGKLICTWEIPKARAGYTAIYEHSTDLKTWTPVVPSSSTDAGTKTQLQFVLPDAKPGFFRAKVQ